MKVKLKEILKEREISLMVLSKKLKKDYKTLLNFSNQKTKKINLILLSEICNELGVKPGDVIGD